MTAPDSARRALRATMTIVLLAGVCVGMGVWFGITGIPGRLFLFGAASLVVTACAASLFGIEQRRRRPSFLTLGLIVVALGCLLLLLLPPRTFAMPTWLDVVYFVIAGLVGVVVVAGGCSAFGEIASERRSIRSKPAQNSTAEPTGLSVGERCATSMVALTMTASVGVVTWAYVIW